ncbi:hypothetical protein SAMN04488032_11930 [Pacificibacter marinus]|uniref:Uncharacterized protein n=1 Tax=Pacificibacter marinus TaxID=658057 RepID=A0A1Y5TPG2_9RHOB|nr:hypothetical protein SAMN04488032_11930 [Pacificibacter marinus]SLN68853.1 hypothetical protein PAM7971_03664 [Pacificibacter marinus]
MFFLYRFVFKVIYMNFWNERLRAATQTYCFNRAVILDSHVCVGPKCTL